MSGSSPSERVPARVPAEPRRSLRLAWVSVALLPLSFLGAIVLGDWLLSVQGYASGSGEPLPVGVLLLAGLPAVAVMIAPTVPGMWFGFRARRLGEPKGLIPAVMAAIAAAWGILTNILPLVLTR